MCLPPIPVMRKIVRHSELILEAHEHYQKRSFRNRIYLNGPQGRTLFTIPLVKGKNQEMLITEVKIANDEPWASVLLKKIFTNYGSAPYFEFIIDDLELILEQSWTTLWDLNTALNEMIIKHLGIAIKVTQTQSYQKIPDPKILDLRGEFKVHPSFFKAPCRYSYDQVFSNKLGFISHLSILDLYMSCGPESLLILKS